MQLAFTILLSVVSSVNCSFYNNKNSAEANASARAQNELMRLAPGQRTIQAAVNLCHQQDMRSNFCAWLALNDTAPGKPVVSVVCYNEFRSQCNKLAIGVKRSDNDERSVADRVRLNRNVTNCSLCSPCAQATSWSACPRCSRVCYCTCAHRGFDTYEYSSEYKDLNMKVYPCHQFCDQVTDCVSSEFYRKYRDESESGCLLYKQAGNAVPEETDFATILYITVFITLGSLILIFAVIVCLVKYCTYTTHVSRMKSAPSAMALSAFVDSTVQQPQQGQQRSADIQNEPPPPAYDAVAKEKH